MNPLSHSQKGMLAEIVEAGHGVLDTTNRVCVGPLKRPVPGESGTWLGLVAGGYVAGERGMIMPTDLGREAAAGHLSGKTRESRG